MKTLLIALFALLFTLFFAGCGDAVSSSGDAGDTVDATNTVDTTNTADTADTGGTTTRAIPTNQNKCYDNTEEITCPINGKDFYGQDAQYPNDPRVFTVRGTTEKTVVDSVTNLEWQQAFVSGQWSEAVSYCDNLSYAGHTDWRLPTIRELSTLPHYGKVAPAIDDEAFPGTPGKRFWSSTSSVHSAGNAWFVNFDDGSVYNDMKAPDTRNVRCVRGHYNSKPLFAVSTVSGDTVMTDKRTGLVWQQSFKGNQSWKAALAYCETLDYAGYTDWRLPDINELKTVIDYEQYNPAIDASAFPGTPGDLFWSSTTDTRYTDDAWVVDFHEGEVYSGNKTHMHNTRCVR